MSGGMDEPWKSFAVQNPGDGITLQPKTILEQAAEDVRTLREHAQANQKLLEKFAHNAGQSLEADAVYDLTSDTITVRVRRRYLDKDGKTIHRRGAVFKIQDEILSETPPGYEYPQKNINRFESIIDEVE